MGEEVSSPRWICRLNIEHYRKLLQTELDAQKRITIERLLAEETAKLARLCEEPDPAPLPGPLGPPGRTAR